MKRNLLLASSALILAAMSLTAFSGNEKQSVTDGMEQCPPLCCDDSDECEPQDCEETNTACCTE